MSDGPVVLITGSAHGIGRAIAQRAAARNARLVLADIDQVALEPVVAELKGAGTDILSLVVDVTERSATQAMAEAAKARFGRIDVLVNNAGGMFTLKVQGKIETQFGPFVESSVEEWDRIVALNLMGVLNCSQAVLPDMIEHGAGRIISISSHSGLVGTEGLAVYSAAKGGVVAFTKALAREVTRHGITVNSVAPRAVNTRVFAGQSTVTKDKIAGSEAGRLGEPGAGEIADAVMFFVMDSPPYVTGQVLPVTGGPV